MQKRNMWRIMKLMKVIRNVPVKNALITIYLNLGLNRKRSW